ncbi:MAG: glycosyltransferase [Candidatus Dadabacteria bacterium]|nr:glycosyltransferase [Candidatus Dadabacteria bacterium]NIQ14431.1 glycosyltransferase [Candidatus Dadabacteria bacterium]
MKILIYSHEFPPYLGGLATSSLKLVKGIASHSHEVVALVPDYGSSQLEVDKNLDCKVVRVPLLGNKILRGIPFFQQITGFFALLYVLMKEKPSIVLFITEEAESVGGLVSKFIDFKSVVRVAGSGILTCFKGNSFTKGLLKYPMSSLYKKSERIIAVSNYTKSLLQEIGVEDSKIRVVYNGVNDQLLKDKKNSEDINKLKSELGITNEDKVMVTIARVLPRKGQDYVIKALPKVLRILPSVKYLVVGEGKYKNRFEELSRELNLENNVIFTGGIENSKIKNYLDISDLFIMTNREWNNKVEGLPNAIIEASSRGLPVIAGNHSGSREAVLNRRTGILVDSRNVDEISSAILEILMDNQKMIDFGLNAKSFVSDNFREDMMIQNYVKVIAEAAGI